MVVSECQGPMEGIPFAFKASWIELYRPSNPACRSKFKIGDCVELNPTYWTPSAKTTAGKCLGTPADLRYGYHSKMVNVKHWGASSKLLNLSLIILHLKNLVYIPSKSLTFTLLQNL